MMGRTIDLQQVADAIRQKRERRGFDADAESIAIEKRKQAIAQGYTERYINKANTNNNPEKSNVADSTPVSRLIEQGKIIEPPLEPLTLAMLPENNSELSQCIEAMETNVEGFGHRFMPRFKREKAPEDVIEAAEFEKIRLENFFAYASLDDDFVTFRRKLRVDYETGGNAYFEIIRDAKGEIQQFNHVPGYQMRLTPVDDVPSELEIPIMELQSDGSVTIVKVKRWKRLRKYVQSQSLYRRDLSIVTSDKQVWFKEFQDPRAINNKTGEVVVDAAEIARLRQSNGLANEMVHFKRYCPRSAYGLPRYVGNLLSIFGDRAAEEINYITFKNNNIPSMAVCVSNGQLTEGTLQRIESFVESQIQGSDNYSKFLIVEAESFGEGEDGGQIKISIQPLTREQHKDAMFQKYSENNRDSTRRSFRLPPIFVGRSDDYTRATAEASRRLADEQIFAPEREWFDAFMNRKMFAEMGVRYWKYKTNSPQTTDNAELVKILASAEKTGGLTPRISREIMSDVLNKDLPEFPDDFPQDVPFSLTMAEAVKNEADPTEPGQQVTALKAFGILGDETSEPFDADEAAAPFIQKLLRIRKSIEDKWTEEVDDVST